MKLIKLFLLSFFLLCNFQAFGQQRINEQHKKNLMAEVKEGILEHKQVNNKKLELLMMKPEVMEFVWELHYEDKLATQQEVLEFQRQFDILAAKRDLTDKEKEDALLDLFDKIVASINNSPLQCIKEGQSCNNWQCCDGLVCADTPGRMLPKAKNNCAPLAKSCSANSDCCSGSCEENLLTREKSCTSSKKCYRPIKIGNSCSDNPVCGEGSCEEHNSNTLGIGECASNGNTCKANSDCCSNSCKSGKCQRSYMCKDCVQQGQIPDKGRKCCEGLMLHKKTNRCVIDIPPFFVENKQNKSSVIIAFIASLFISTADAQSDVDKAKEALKSGAINEFDLMGVGIKDAVPTAKEQIEIQRGEVTAAGLNRAGGYLFEMKKGSDFESCEINYKNDYLIGMMEKRKGHNVSLFDLQLSLLAFEYVALGTGVDDHWKVKAGDKSGSIHSVAKAVAQKSRASREGIFETVSEREVEIKCLCYDKNGFPNLNDEQKSFFQSSCPAQFADYEARVAAMEELGQESLDLGDASGIKYKEMMHNWYRAIAGFEEELFIANTNLSKDMLELKNWALTNNWYESEIRKYELFNFSIKNYTGQVMFGTALAAALVTAGVIAITGGFAATATLSAWAAAGIISASAVTGSLGVWFIGSLKGAWDSSAPMIYDQYVKGRENYKCGKKDFCSDFTRVLHQPYNKVCGKHISANACIRSFLVTENADGETRYLIDPWIPYNVPANLVIRDNRDYSDLLEKGFQRARGYLKGNKPAEVTELQDNLLCQLQGGENGNPISENCIQNQIKNVIHPAGFRPPSYLEETFVDEVAVSQYLPELRSNENQYRLSQETKDAIMKGAREYIIKEGFFNENETQNLDNFANYVWDYHYVFPRISKADMISYPTPGLVTYLHLVAAALDSASQQSLDGVEAVTNLVDLSRIDLERTREVLDLTPRVRTGGAEDLMNQATGTFQQGVTQVGDTGVSGISGSNFNTGSVSGTAAVTGIGVDNLNAGSLEATAQRFQNAVATRNEIDKAKKEDLENFMEQVGNTDRGKKILAAQKELMGAFLSPSNRGAFDGPNSGMALNNLAAGDLKNASLDGKGAVGSADNRGALTTAMPNSGKNPLMGSGSGSAQSVVGNRSNSVGGISMSEAERMREAIQARDRAGQDAFATKDGQSLWEIVTNTYIRAYDKLLPSRTKDLE